jgi:hypothetical protein
LPPIARIGRADTEGVVCFFSRDDSVIRCEVRPVDDGGGYELVIDHPDAVVQVERFSGAEALNRRWMDVEGLLLRQGWRGPAPRQQLKNQ